VANQSILSPVLLQCSSCSVLALQLSAYVRSFFSLDELRDLKALSLQESFTQEASINVDFKALRRPDRMSSPEEYTEEAYRSRSRSLVIRPRCTVRFLSEQGARQTVDYLKPCPLKKSECN
jgi:hypothetical protein